MYLLFLTVYQFDKSNVFDQIKFESSIFQKSKIKLELYLKVRRVSNISTVTYYTYMFYLNIFYFFICFLGMSTRLYSSFGRIYTTYFILMVVITIVLKLFNA